MSRLKVITTNLPVLHPTTEAMMIREELHSILLKYGITNNRMRAECGLEILKWIERLFSEERMSGQ